MLYFQHIAATISAQEVVFTFYILFSYLIKDRTVNSYIFKSCGVNKTFLKFNVSDIIFATVFPQIHLIRHQMP